MQGFSAKYYLCEAERGDFAGNRQSMTLHTGKAWRVPLRHDFHQADRKYICEDVEVHPVRGRVKGIKSGLQRKEYKRETGKAETGASCPSLPMCLFAAVIKIPPS